MPSEPSTTPTDRRAEPRPRADGRIDLRPEGFTPSLISGQMLDISRTGFRARHTFRGLTSGQMVRYAFGRVEGRARVVWTRIMADHVESGFLILPAGAPSSQRR